MCKTLYWYWGHGFSYACAALHKTVLGMVKWPAAAKMCQVDFELKLQVAQVRFQGSSKPPPREQGSGVEAGATTCGGGAR